MTFEDIDLSITCSAKLRPRKRPSISEEIALGQEEIRLNYYLNMMAKEIERRILFGQKIILLKKVMILGIKVLKEYVKVLMENIQQKQKKK